MTKKLGYSALHAASVVEQHPSHRARLSYKRGDIFARGAHTPLSSPTAAIESDSENAELFAARVKALVDFMKYTPEQVRVVAHHSSEK